MSEHAALPDFPATPHTTARRDDRGSFDRAEAYAILDEGLVAHVGFVLDDRPFVIPMVNGRDGDRLLLHGSVATRLARALAAGAPVCVEVTLVDALVVARSQFHHSINYRSVVIVGEALRTTDEADVARAFEAIVDHVIPGRTAEARPANRIETRQTSVIVVPIETASVKVRTGPPVDDEEDIAAGGWAGVLPLDVVAGAPVPDADAGHTPVPPSIAGYRRGG
jgi:nitroimidazol reductase NimA-like FMN-containing flavoprotein (pyridoxamine 5'-phosphate oxidase superfamily)